MYGPLRPLWDSWDQLRRRVTFLWYVRQYILDHETESMASNHCDTLLWAIDSLIEENEPKLENAKLEFEKVYTVGFLNDQEEELLSKYSSLETWHNNLMKTRRYILDLGLLDGSSARVQ